MKYLKEIHDSNLFGVVVEMGCSATIASTLMDEPGSSKTIYRSEQPYNKEYQETLYGKFKRSVSREFIKNVLEIEATKESANNRINFILASSWQLIAPEDPLVYAHGWVGLFDIKRNVKHYLHFSFNRNMSHNYREFKTGNTFGTKYWDGNINSLPKINPNEYADHKEAYDLADRKRLLQIIGQLATDILHTAIDGNIKDLTKLNANVAILDMAYINDEVNYDLLVSTLEKANGDYFLIFKNNSVIRIEDLMREGEAFSIQKGSFNPLHHGHIKMMNESVANYNSIPAFLISTYRYDKPHINYEELKERIATINKASYPLIICKSITFYETFDLLRTWSHGKGFYFPVGNDTINRIYKTDLDYVNSCGLTNPNVEKYIKDTIEKYKGNFKFLVFDRLGFVKYKEIEQYNEMIENVEHEDDGISSSAIRDGIMVNKLKI